MKIKSLLIGSTAALAAVSSARAADAVTSEPEAVEYVRVCDAFGVGYFYIPGTETCLKIAGRVRYQINFQNGDRGWKKEANLMMNFTAKSDTELGTLTSYIELSAARLSGPQGRIFLDTNGNGVQDPGEGTRDEGELNFDHAWISLGGLKMGWSDTLYDADLDTEGDVSGGGAVHFINYTFSGANGFAATLALEEEQYNNNYVPNIVGKLAYTQDWGSVEGWVAYDDDDNGALAGDAGWAVKGRLTAKVGSDGTLRVLGTFNSNNNFYANGGKWTLGASYRQKLNTKLTLTGLVQYQADTNFATAGTPDNFIFGGVADYTIVPNFTTKLAIWHETRGPNPGVTRGFLRFQRSF
jgi:Porin subfamily